MLKLFYEQTVPYDYEKLLVFQTIYLTALSSPKFSFREAVYYLLEKALLKRVWGVFFLVPFWLKGGRFYYIECTQTQNIKRDLIRLAWLEKLKIVELYLFIAPLDSEQQFMTENGPVLLSRWVYDQVTAVIPENRIAVMGRAHAPTVAGLPVLPAEYKLLNVSAEPPTFSMKKWKEFHSSLQTAIIEDLYLRD